VDDKLDHCSTTSSRPTATSCSSAPARRRCTSSSRSTAAPRTASACSPKPTATQAIPRSPLADAATFVLVTVPSKRRARTVAEVLANGPWPIAVHPWAAGSEQPLAVVERAETMLSS
jgi:hypothetical protein